MKLDYKDLDGVLELLNNDHHEAESMDDLALRLITEIKFEFLKRITRIKKEGDKTPTHQKPLFLLLSKLVSDGHVDRFNEDAEESKDWTYVLNYDGIEFIEHGGYQNKKDIDSLIGSKLNKQKSVLTLASVATVIVGVYYAIQLLKEFGSFFHNLFYH